VVERKEAAFAWVEVDWCGTIGLIILGTIGWRFSYIPVNDNFTRALTFGVCAAFIVQGALALEERLRPVRALVFLGEASYGIYLLHIFMLSFLARLIVQRTDFWRKSPELAFLVLIALILFFSCVYLKFFERPALRFVHGWVVNQVRAISDAVHSEGARESVAGELRRPILPVQWRKRIRSLLQPRSPA